VRRRPDIWFVAASAAATAVFLALPAGPVADGLAIAITSACVPAFCWGVVRGRPLHPVVWWSLGAAITLMLAGDVLARVSGEAALADLAYTCGYLAAVAAAVLLLRARGSRHDREGLIDAAVLATCTAVLLWQYAIAPNLAVASSAPERAFAILYPLFDVLLLGLLLRLVLSPGERSGSLWYFVAALGLALAGDVAYGVLGLPPTSGWLEASSVLARAMIPAAALHPSMRTLSQARRPALEHLQPTRLFIVCGSLLLLTVILGLRAWDEQGAAGLGFAAGPSILTVLLTWRLARVVGDHGRITQQLSHQAYHDPLTGLPNRRLLTERIQAELDLAGHRRGVVALLFCDLDGFKAVNDRLGHDAGDALLRQVAARLLEARRAGDTLGRLGGDEFLWCLPQVADRAEAEAIAGRVREALARPFAIGPETVRVGASVGITLAGAQSTADELIQAADEAMYAVKRRRRADPLVPTG
jgi:diguanylate cyclase (GGDEF)-like protein